MLVENVKKSTHSTVQSLEYDGTPLVPEFFLLLVYKLQPASQIKSSMKIHLGILNGGPPQHDVSRSRNSAHFFATYVHYYPFSTGC
jgi:hypothetical protein